MLAQRASKWSKWAGASCSFPKDALRKDDGRDVVFVLTGDKVERRAVTLSVSEGEDAIVTAGIEGGESVVVKGPPDLEDGDQVEVTSFMSVNVNGTLVKVDEATKYFKRGSEEIHVLEKLDMQVPEGEFLALMGPSGSGKSTLLNLIGCNSHTDTDHRQLRIGTTLSRAVTSAL